MNYTKNDIIHMIEKYRVDMSAFYKRNFINYRGVTTDTHEYYSEIIAEWLLSNIHVLDEIKTVVRNSSYFTPTHHGVPRKDDSNRTEELIAMQMFRQREIVGLGRAIDYQTPLKNKRTDKTGKIDLLSFENNTLHILELKEPDSHETMLRCVLEGYTYLKTVCHSKLLDSFNLSKDTIIKTNPLVALSGNQHNEIKEGRTKLNNLMEALDIKPLYYHKKDNIYYVTEE